MKNSVRDYLVLFSAIVFILLNATSQQAHSQTETILYAFGTQAKDGDWPWSGVVMDGKGNLYGTTELGGASGMGTVFEIDTAGNETVLHSFGSSGDGSHPYGSLLLDKKHNLYGTTTQGGAFGLGTVFRIDRKGNESVLYSFGSQSPDGANPYADLIMDLPGNLYGTTGGGGAFGKGTVFELTASGQEIVLYSFGTQSGDGAAPECGLVRDTKGNLFGTTNAGGVYGQGTVFELTANGTEIVLHSFAGGSKDGSNPWAGPVMDKKGNLYGTAGGGGSHGLGIVYKVTPAGKKETVFYNFGSQSGDGQNPYAGLVMDKKGNFYGTTVVGGGFGTVYTLTPAGQLTKLYTFQNQSGDGMFPYGRILRDRRSGNLYGTTLSGGINLSGTVFKLTP